MGIVVGVVAAAMEPCLDPDELVDWAEVAMEEAEIHLDPQEMSTLGAVAEADKMAVITEKQVAPAS